MTSGTEIPMKSPMLGYSRSALLTVVAALTLSACVSGSSNSVLPADSNEAESGFSNDSTDSTDGFNNDESDNDAQDRSDRLSSAIQPSGGSLSIDVTRVSDGDSVRANSAEGELEIRLLGINAPEQDECFGQDAADELERLLSNGDVTISPWPAELDDFGRELGFLFADGVLVNLSLVETGHVVARAQSDHGLDTEFEDAEQNASTSGVGLWASDACGAPTDAQLVIVEVFENAPGDDRENPNGEYVVIENVGDNDVDLEGWGIRDESTRHRFTFPSLVIGAGEQLRLRTGCGDTDLGADPIEAFWCDPEPPVWNNGGDTAFLLNPNGGIADNYVVAG